MSTSPVITSVGGAAFSINTAVANLDPLLNVRDFTVLENGVLTTNSNSYNKTTPTTVTYNGPALAVGTTIELRRNTPRGQRTTVLPGTKVRAVDWNNEIDRRVRIQEEVDLYGAGGGFNVRLPIDDPYGPLWATDSLFSPTRKALFDRLETYINANSPVLLGVPTAPTPPTVDNGTRIATTAYVKSNTALLAPSTSPVLAGNPTAPTPLTTDNSTSIATTAYVKNNLSSYLPLAGGTVTGVLNATTVPTTTNNTQVATTAYVKSNLSSYALLASPALTGVPTVPTASNGVKTTQAASMLAVQRSRQPIVVARHTTVQTIPAAITPIVFGTVVADVNGVYNSTTGVFTAPYAGWYQYSALVTVNSTALLAVMIINSGGSEVLRLAHSFLNTPGLLGTSGTAMEFLNAGDTRRFAVTATSTTTTIADTNRALFHMSINYMGIDTAT
jgi:hypothetical protein